MSFALRFSLLFAIMQSQETTDFGEISDREIRSSFINATRSETAKLNLPQYFDSLDWENLDFLGWRDAKMPLRAYLIVPTDRGLTGILLRAPEGGAKKNRSVLCEMCRDVFSKEDVLLWVAKRGVQSGRNGNTVGTLICADFICSANVRKLPPANEINPDPAVVVKRQIEDLRSRIGKFVGRVAE